MFSNLPQMTMSFRRSNISFPVQTTRASCRQGATTSFLRPLIILITVDDRLWLPAPRAQRSARSSGGRRTVEHDTARAAESDPSSPSDALARNALAHRHWNTYAGTPRRARTAPTALSSDVPAPDADDLDFELHGENVSDDASKVSKMCVCCDGRHTVGGHHHHLHHHHLPVKTPRLTKERSLVAGASIIAIWTLSPRTCTPLRRLRGHSDHGRSAQSHEAGTGGGLFSWGPREDGKSRFGSRRSTKTSVPALE